MGRPDLSRRTELDQLQERMDGACSYEELRGCLRGIARVNRMTQAYRPTMAWLEQVVERPERSTTSQDRDAEHPRPLRIVDVGCGYGDMLRRIERWARRRGVAVELTGVDLNPDAVRTAREATPAESRIEWIAGDVYSCAAAEQADVAISSLLTHHLAEAEIVRFLQWMERTARRGWFVNDLHRQAVPYAVFSVTMRGPWWHRFIRHDGLASIRRSFVPEDWRRMCRAAGLDPAAVRIAEYRPARLCVERVKPMPHPPERTEVG